MKNTFSGKHLLIVLILLLSLLACLSGCNDNSSEPTQPTSPGQITTQPIETEPTEPVPTEDENIWNGINAAFFTANVTDYEGEIGEESIVCATKSIQFFCDNAEMDVISSVEIYNCLMPEDIKTMYDDLNSCIIATEKLISILKQ